MRMHTLVEENEDEEKTEKHGACYVHSDAAKHDGEVTENGRMLYIACYLTNCAI